ncbi:MAG TPA: DUF1150 family protein [Acetobacteraceae bacterium]|jgi:hypothetical protein|nr:DUF1150 family protein [Acetobacteraceae bacterium]
MTNENNATIPTGSFNIRKLSAAEFGNLGMSQIAYVKPVMVDGTRAFAIHAADGTPMAVAENQDVALAAIAQHEMLAALVQ